MEPSTRNQSFYGALLALAVPVALQNLISFAAGFADNLMVSALGDTSVSGVYLGGQVQTLLQMFSGGVEGALLILSAQYWGRRDAASIKKIIAAALRLALGCGLALTLACALFPTTVLSLFSADARVIAAGRAYLRVVCLSYPFFCLTQALIAALRSVELARVGMYASAIALAANLVLNYLLIFGRLGLPRMGVAGAAVATLASRVLECALVILYLRVRDRRLRLRLRELRRVDRALSRDFLRCALPVVGGQLVWAFNLLAGAAILGRFPADVVAAASIANSMSALAYVAMNGAATAVGILTGKLVGAGDDARVRRYARTVQWLFLGLGLVTGAGIALLRRPFVDLYSGVTPGAAACAAQLIAVLSVTMVGTCYQCAGLFGLVKAGGDLGFVFKNDAIFVFLVVLPSALAAVRLGAPAWVVFACLKSDQILKCVVAYFKIRRFDWMKNLTRSALPGDGAPLS